MVPEITVITIYFRDVLVLRSCFLIECGTFFEIYRQTKKLVHYHLKQKQFNNKTGSICIEIINYIMITNGIVSECWYYYQGYLISPRKLKQEMISSAKKRFIFSIQSTFISINFIQRFCNFLSLSKDTISQTHQNKRYFQRRLPLVWNFCHRKRK